MACPLVSLLKTLWGSSRNGVIFHVERVGWVVGHNEDCYCKGFGAFLNTMSYLDGPLEIRYITSSTVWNGAFVTKLFANRRRKKGNLWGLSTQQETTIITYNFSTNNMGFDILDLDRTAPMFLRLTFQKYDNNFVCTQSRAPDLFLKMKDRHKLFTAVVWPQNFQQEWVLKYWPIRYWLFPSLHCVMFEEGNLYTSNFLN